VVVVVMVVVARVPLVAREAEAEATKGFPLRQQFAELFVQFQQAKLRHVKISFYHLLVSRCRAIAAAGE
jgi:hypothetical protein